MGSNPIPSAMVEFRADAAAAVLVMNEAGAWLAAAGLDPSGLWRPSRLALTDEFYAGFVDGVPAVAGVLQSSQTNPTWSVIDDLPAVYLHWISVRRAYAGTGLPAQLIEFARGVASSAGRLRLDTDAGQPALMKIYEGLGFELLAVVDDGVRETALFELRLV